MPFKDVIFALSTLLLLSYVNGTSQRCLEKNQCDNPNKAINPNDYWCLAVGKYRVIKEDNHCVKHTCVEVEEDGNQVAKIEKSYACRTPEGYCKYDGVSWKDKSTCTTYQCVVTIDTGVHIQSKIVKRECPNPLYEAGSGFYQCIGEGKSVRETERCLKYTCSSIDNNGVITMKMQQSFYGCRVDGECVLENEIRRDEDTCSTRSCEISQLNATHFEQKMAIKEFGCRFNGLCYDEGDTYRNETICVTRVCQVNTETLTSSMAIQDQGCRYNEQCFADGEASKDNCVIRECQVNTEQRSALMAIAGLECKDNVDGACHADGSPMPYLHNGNTFECVCKVSGSPPTLSSSIDQCVYKTK